MHTGELGYWWRSLGGPPAARAPLPGPTQADVAIVGAGYTGLWTAYYLKRARPSLEIVVLEREQAGFGASGRNGGWVSGFFSGPPRVYQAHPGDAGYAALQRTMFETVDVLGAFLAEHAIDADFVKGAASPLPSTAPRLSGCAKSSPAAARMDWTIAICICWAPRSYRRGYVWQMHCPPPTRRTWRGFTRRSCSPAWRRRSSVSA